MQERVKKQPNAVISKYLSETMEHLGVEPGGSCPRGVNSFVELFTVLTGVGLVIVTLEFSAHAETSNTRIEAVTFFISYPIAISWLRA